MLGRHNVKPIFMSHNLKVCFWEVGRFWAHREPRLEGHTFWDLVCGVGQACESIGNHTLKGIVYSFTCSRFRVLSQFWAGNCK